MVIETFCFFFKKFINHFTVLWFLPTSSISILIFFFFYLKNLNYIILPEYESLREFGCAIPIPHSIKATLTFFQHFFLGIKKTKHKLTAQQCLEIAEMAHDSRRYVHMADWLKEAERIMDDPNLQDRVGNITRMQINEFLAWMNYLV